MKDTPPRISFERGGVLVFVILKRILLLLKNGRLDEVDDDQHRSYLENVG